MSIAGEPRSGRVLALPSWLLLALVVLPLAAGSRTLYYRDVLGSHYPLVAAKAQLQDGRLTPPLIDPYHGGGQPLLGNPNAVPLYPSNLLYRVGHPLWALNAHFWLHWLLAPLAGFWLGRAWRLGRAGAWVCGVAWATCGYVLSLLNLYNLVAAAALAPALVASFVDLAGAPGDRRRLAVAAAITGLTLLGGDPASALLAGLLAAAAWLATAWPAGGDGCGAGSLLRPGRGALVASALGLVLAAPVVVATLRILPRSYRGVWSYAPDTMLGQSWHPATLFDWWIPGVFGRLDPTFWGGALFGGNPPLFGSLAPGWIVLALVLAAGRRRRRLALWAWGAVALGLLLALGGYNPLLRAAAGLPGAALLRYPVKAWLAVALGLSLLAGAGFERLARGARRGVFLGTLLAVLTGSAALWASLSGGSLLVRRLAAWAPERLTGLFLLTEIDRWSRALTVSCLAVGLAIVVTVLARRKPVLLALLPVLHTASQLVLLAPLYDSDDAAPYRQRPALVDTLPNRAGLRVEHGGFDEHFGPQRIDARATPDPSLAWWSRASFAELSHRSGIALGLSYPFVHSPEGLDSFYSVAMGQALAGLDDAARLRLLELAGVGVLLLDRPLAGAAALRVERLAQRQSLGRTLHVYRLLHAAPEISMATRVRAAGDLRAALDLLTEPAFDPRIEVVLPERDAAGLSRGGAAGGGDASEPRPTVLVDEPERLEVACRSATPALLVVRRAWLPLWRAEVDGEPAKVLVADGWQMAVAVPAGDHHVRFAVGRLPESLALLAAALALAAVVWLWLVPAQDSGV